MSPLHKILVLVLLSAILFIACTTRREYISVANTATASSNAININTATAAELERIPHIGPKTAENIVQFRIDNGPFRRAEHLMQVRGISEKRFIEIRPYLTAE
jgi:competence ComEA-like helix-hairpin-helix protein